MTRRNVVMDESMVVRDSNDPNQTGLFDAEHDGETYDSSLDKVRLNAQQQRIFDVMKDGQWRSLEAIASITEDPQASVSARLRDFRKVKFGGFEVQRRRHDNGLHLYRLNME